MRISVKRIILRVNLFAVIVYAAGGISHVKAMVIADAAADYLAAAGAPSAALATPPTGWSYLGSDSANGGVEVALAAGEVGNQGPAYLGFSGVSGFGTAAVYGTNTADPLEFEIFDNGDVNGAVVGTDLLLHPGQAGNSDEFVIARYTISAADAAIDGVGVISGSFRELVVGGGAAAESVQVDIFHNSTSVFSTAGGTTAQGTQGVLTQEDGAFNLSGLSFAENDTIDFVVGINGHFGADEVALQAAISVVDESEVDVTASIEVDRDTGAITLKTSPGVLPLNILGYEITSESQSLDRSQWLSIAENYDAGSPGPGQLDIDDSWTELTSTPGDGGDLSEFESDGGDGAFLGASLDIDIGSGDGSTTFGPWVRNPIEDVEVNLLLTDGSVAAIPVSYVGNNGGAFNRSDLDFDGDVDTDDWMIYRDGLDSDLSTSTRALAYQAGDLDGDLDNDVDDFAIFQADFLAANGGVSLAAALAVPESSTVSCLLLGLFASVIRRRNTTARHMSRYRYQNTLERSDVVKQQRRGPGLICLPLFVATGAVLLASSKASSQTIADAAADYVAAAGGSTDALTVFPTGWSYLGATLANSGTEVPLTFGAVGNQGAAYEGFVGVSGFGTASVYGTNTSGTSEFEIFGNGDANSAVVGSDLLLHSGQIGNDDEFVIARYTISASDVASGNGVISGSFRELVIGGGAAVDSISGQIFHNDLELFSVVGNQSTANALTQEEGAFNITGLTFAENDTIDFVVGSNGHFGADEAALQAVISLAVDPLNLVVNTVTGAVALQNPAAEADFDIDFYTISSAANSLSFDDWSSLQDQDRSGFPAGDGSGNGWEQSGGSDDGTLTEAYLTGSSIVESGDYIFLGNAFDETVFGSGSDGDLTFEYRLAQTGEVVTGNVTYVSTIVSGDFNADGIVDTADYTVWRDNFGAATESTLNGAGSGTGGVDIADYLLWKSNFGQITAAASSIAVPEPGGVLLLLGVSCCLAAVYASRRRMPHLETRLWPALVLGALTPVAINPAHAAVTNDRVLLFGEGAAGAGGAVPENGSPGAVVGSGVSNPAAGDTVDNEGPSGAFLGLNQTGNPLYVNANTGSFARPGTLSGDVGILFDGSDDRLTGLPLNRPDELADLVLLASGTTYPIDYSGITARGLQLWVYPEASSLGSQGSPTSFQSIVFDTAQSGGPAINAEGQWTQTFGGSIDGDDALPASVGVPSGDTWYHVMQHVYVHGQQGSPSIVAGSGAAQAFTSVLYVDGVAVSATNGDVNTGGTDGFTSELVVGASQVEDDAPPVYGNYFSGAVDNLALYVHGDNESGIAGDLSDGEDWGTFDLFEDNEWIANAIAEIPGGELIDGDVNRDGVVDQFDVDAFVLGWQSENRINGATNSLLVGDWNTWGNGDMNHDGVTNLFDAFILHQSLASAGAGGLDFSLLNSVNVPEPAGLCSALLPLVTCAFLRPQGRLA